MRIESLGDKKPCGCHWKYDWLEKRRYPVYCEKHHKLATGQLRVIKGKK